MDIKIIADISPIGFESLGIKINELPKWFMNSFEYLRLDYGFTENEIIIIGNQVNICLNASTMTPDNINKINEETSKKVQPFDNFYPKEFSGLERDYFINVNRKLKIMGFEIFAFIPGETKRGPIFKGLPTLEEHRNKSALYSYLDFKHNLNIDCCFFGDQVIFDFIKFIQKDDECLNIKIKNKI